MDPAIPAALLGYLKVQENSEAVSHKPLADQLITICEAFDSLPSACYGCDA